MSKFIVCALMCFQLFGVDEIFQVSTFGALKDGVFNGDYTLEQLKLKGNFGIGVCNNINGEWVAFQGKFYKTKPDGSVEEVALSEKIPFAVVTTFKAPTRFSLNNVTSLADLDRKIPLLFKNENVPCAILIEGNFESIELSHLKEQFPPYRPLSETKKGKSSVSHERGMLIGYWFPSYMKEFNSKNIHFHYLSRDRSHCGSLENVKFKTAKVAIQRANSLDIYFPKLQTFSNARIGTNSSAAQSGS